MARPLVVNALELLRRPGSQKEISLDVIGMLNREYRKAQRAEKPAERAPMTTQ